MRLDRNLREASSCSYPEGYSAPPTGMVNTGEAFLQIGGGEAGGRSMTTTLMPSLLRLRGRLVPVPLEGEEVMAELVEDSKTLPRCEVYKMNSPLVYKAIRIEYAGMGGYQMLSGQDLTPFVGDQFLGGRLNNKVLYEKNFIFQRSGTVTCTKTNLGNNRTLVNPPNLEGGYPLWGFCGFYRFGCQVSKIEQIFFTIVKEVTKDTGGKFTKDRETSAIQIVSSSWLKEKGVSLSRGGKLGQESVVFMDKPSKDQGLSLSSSLEGGAAKLKLVYGVDENGKDLIQSYHSVQFDQKDIGGDEIDITFRVTL